MIYDVSRVLEEHGSDLFISAIRGNTLLTLVPLLYLCNFHVRKKKNNKKKTRIIWRQVCTTIFKYDSFQVEFTLSINCQIIDVEMAHFV